MKESNFSAHFICKSLFYLIDFLFTHPINIAIFKKVSRVQSSGFCEGTRESSSMRTSKNRSSRARYTCAGCATGRSGRVAVLLCFISLFCSVLPVALSAAFLFSPPGLSRSPSPFLPVAVSPFSPPLPLTLSLTRVVVRLFYYFYKCRRHTMLLPLVLSRRASPLLVHHGSIVARRKMRILIWYCLILFMYARG